MPGVSRYSVGIDVGKQHLVVQVQERQEQASRGVGESVSFPNQRKGYRQLQSWLHKAGVWATESRMVMEATGMYWKRVAQYFQEQGWEVYVIEPRRIKAYGMGLGYRAKTDRNDAKVIALYGHSGQGRRWVPDSKEIGELRSLLRHREDVLHLVGQLRNQKEAREADPFGAKEVQASLNRLIRQVEAERDRLEKNIAQCVQQTPAWQEMVRLLRSVPGIGDITLAWLLVETHAFQRFSTSQALSSYVGVIPYAYQSGTSVRRKDHISNACHRTLRSVLYMAGLTAIRVNPLLKKFYLRLRQRQKPFKVALIAVLHKLLRILFALLRKKQPFDPFYLPSSKGVIS